MGDGTDSSGNRYPVSLELEVENRKRWYVYDWSLLSTYQNDNVLVAFQHTTNHVYRVSTGTCDFFGVDEPDSILFTKI